MFLACTVEVCQVLAIVIYRPEKNQCVLVVPHAQVNFQYLTS